MVKIFFLGTNGWFSTETGNTSCVLIDSDKYYIVFDAGDGINKLDNYITSDKPIFLFLSHFHLDHVLGFHIINKFNFKQGINVYGQKGTKKILNYLVQHPFTLPLKELPTKVIVHELTEGQHNVPFPVTCKYLLHSDPCFGYRVNLEGKTIVYCTDTAVCDNSLELSNNADILIHECASRSGHSTAKWPHTNPKEAAELALKANIKQLVLFHFDAEIYRSIEDRMQAETEARKIFQNTKAAFDGTYINI
jgi:ribonuclease BN (tRNA processing enzyme)